MAIESNNDTIDQSISKKKIEKITKKESIIVKMNK